MILNFVHASAVSRGRVYLLQSSIISLSGLIAFLLRFDGVLRSDEWRLLTAAIPIWIVVKLGCFRARRLDRSPWAYTSIPDVADIFTANLLGSLISAAAMFLIGLRGFPRSVFILEFVVCTGLLAAARLLVRAVFDRKSRRPTTGKPALIYGAGRAGVLLLREIQRNPKCGYRVKGFVDDDAQKHGMRIDGFPVLGGGAAIRRIAESLQVQEVLIVIPSASAAQMVSILTHCHDAEVSCKTVPGLDELINRSHLLGQIRDVAVEDLLGRSPVTLDDSSVRADIEGRVVLITGAAGSIGREICRQVCRFNPAEVIAFDISEGGIFELQREIGSRFPRLGFRAEIGSIRSRRRLERLFQRYRPAVVFHAAAYKHVPLMEEHVCEAVQNNVLGTFNLALAAANAGTDQFLMISTDKAVRPSSVMGLTKRVAEMVIESMRHTETRFAAVRFGNVLGSSGSVVPLFKQQISCGGPVQVTHPEMRRYFMTIPEAVQLVLQASSMGTEATFVLDMGEPVRIVDLAKNLIVLSGLRPGVDIQIEFSGIRQGEKLNEELSDAHESLRPTRHKQISVIEPSGYAPPIAPEFLERIRDLCEQGDETAVILCLKELVPEYSVSASVLRRLAQPTELARHLKESESRTLQLETSAGA